MQAEYSQEILEDIASIVPKKKLKQLLKYFKKNIQS